MQVSGSRQSRNKPIYPSFIPKSFSVIDMGKFTDATESEKRLYKQVRDLTLSLKIEHRDHELTKKELTDVKAKLEE
jgi:hypothetical protein